ncbi:MAG: hypothetical protein MJ072_01085 [Clostridia bacterium]|nr:hypothetical protein [Clostridia bacterium]
MIGYKSVKGETQGVKTIVTVWQIDSFEGGKGSRQKFLLKTASYFEKENEGVHVLVVSESVDGAEEKMKNGVFPDVLSFGTGVDVTGMTALNREGFKGGEINGKNYAVPWAKGGYFLIFRGENGEKKHFDEILFSQGNLTAPTLAFRLSGYSAKRGKKESPQNAYYSFITGKTDVFVGTQRDVNRVITNGAEANVIPLSEYNDLYQYASITSTVGIKREYAEKFLTYILSEKTQRRLTEIGMYSPYFDGLYGEGITAKGEVKNKFTLSAFTGKAGYSSLLVATENAYLTDYDEFKIKNLIISLD